MTTDLEPCPFCGNTGVYRSNTIQGNFAVICTAADCGGMAVGYSKPSAIAAWNRRALSAPEAAHPGAEAAEAVAWLVTGNRDEEEWVNAHANEVTAVDEARRHKGTCTPLYPHPTPRPTAPTDCDIRGLVERLEVIHCTWNNPPSEGLPEGAGVVLEAATALAAMSAKLDEAETERDAAKFDLAVQRGRTQIAEAKLAEVERERANLAIDLSGTAYRKIEAEDSIKNLQAANADLRRRADAMDKALEPFAAFAEKAERFVQGRADFGGDPVMPTKHFRLADFQRARAARAIGGSDG